MSAIHYQLIYSPCSNTIHRNISHEYLYSKIDKVAINKFYDLNNTFNFKIISSMLKTPILDKDLRLHLDSITEDGRDIFLIADDQVRITAANCTNLVNQMRANHKTGLLESYVLGQAYIAGILLSSCVKGNDRIQLQIECGGPIKGISIESWACGAVRGYLMNNPIPLEKPLTSLDTSLLFGPGFISVSKVLEGSKEPVTGTVMMSYGNIAKDLALYFTESEQTPTLIYISLKFDEKGNIIGAGGLFIQALPGCDEKILDSLQEQSSRLSNLGLALSRNESIEEYVLSNFNSYKPRKLAHSPIGFSCPCSKDGFKKYLKKLPQKEKEGILKGSFPLNLECFNCGSIYSFEKSDVETLFDKEEKK